MFELDYCGVNSDHQKPFEIRREKGLPEYTLLLIKAEADFLVNGKAFVSKPGTAVLIPPGMSFCYGSKKCGYNDDWLHFTCEPKDFHYDKIPLGEPLSVRDMGELSHHLQRLYRESVRKGERQKEVQDLWIRLILVELERQVLDKNGQICLFLSKMDSFRQSMYRHPEMDHRAAVVAEELGISVSYLEHLYQECFDISFHKDLIRARMEKARFYLTKTEMSVEEVAYNCGYRSQEHFMREFKKMWGVTALQYRKKYAK